MRILVVEDDRAISALIEEYFEARGHAVYHIHDGLAVAETVRACAIELVMLDLMLPCVSGENVLAALREVSTVPVIVLSARGATRDKIELLRLGADDYVTKPFDLEELLARAESACRRAQQIAMPTVLTHQGLRLDVANHVATLDGAALVLTAKEFAILECLLRHPEKVYSKANLFESVWGMDYASEDNTLNVHISHLRQKLHALAPDRTWIDTVWGIGYRLHPAENATKSDTPKRVAARS